MSGEKLRLASLSVLGGSLHGRRRDLEEVVAEVLVGADPDCHLVVDLPSISPIHARLWTDLDQAEVQDTRAPRGVYVNTKRVEGQAVLRPGDVLWLGPPQDPGSVCIQCRFEPWVEVLPGASQHDGDGPVDEAPETDRDGVPVDEAPEAESPTESASPGVAPLDDAVTEPGPSAEAGHGAELSVPAPESAEDYEPVVIEDDAPPAPASPSTPEAPFFVDESDGVPLEHASANTAEGVFTLEEAAAAPGESAAPTPAPVAADDGADEWAIAEPGPAVVEPLPAPDVSDEFFVSEAPPGSAEFEPEPHAPQGAGPLALDDSAPPEPAFVDFGAFEPEPTTATASEAPPMAHVEPDWDTAAAPPFPAPAPTLGAPSLAAPAGPAAPIAPAAPAARVATPAAPAPAASAPPSAAPAEVRKPAPTPAEPARPRSATTIPKRPPAAAARPGPAARRPSARPAARRSSGGSPAWLRPAALGVAAVAVLAAAGFGAWRLLAGGVRVVAVEPARVRVGQRATITGRGFAPEAAGNVVTFDDHGAKVVSVRPESLEVEVPDVPVESGGDRRVSVVVRSGSHASAGVPVTVIQGPRLHGLSPEAALPGEEVLLAGAGWGLGAMVRFGRAPAQVVAVDASSIRVIVPAEAGTPGTRAPVVVTVGGVESNAAPFVVGRLPVVSEVTPAAAAPGDVVQVSGLGFQLDAPRNDVRIAGVPALVLAATGDSLKVVVPRLPAGDLARVLEVRVPGSQSVGQVALQAAGMPDVVDLRFVAEPFAGTEGRPHAVVATGLGPAFAFAASGGKSAAARAHEAAQKLNGTVPALRTTLGLNFEARGYDASPALGLAGQPDALVRVTAEDAAAYNEDWTGLKGKGGPVTPARLLRWWEAVARDLVLATVRAERPRFAAELAPEGRALGQLFDAARRPGQQGLAQQSVAGAKPALRDAVRLVAFRVPDKVEAPPTLVPGPAAPTAPTPAPAVARMPTDGTMRGSETEDGQLRYLTVELRGAGTIAYEGGITLTLPLSSLERGRDRLRFSVPIRGAMRYYSGKWDGEKVTGPVSTDAGGRNVVGTFELRPR